MLVDNLIDFKGCNPAEHSHHYDANHISMFEFIKMRNEIYNKISILTEFNFAQDNRLLIKIRNYQDDYIKDN